MASSRVGMEKFVEKVATIFNVSRREATRIIDKVISSLDETLVDNIDTNGFAIKLNKLGKLTIYHREASMRRIPLTGEVKLTSKKRKVKFTTLGTLRQIEKVKPLQISAAAGESITN